MVRYFYVELLQCLYVNIEYLFTYLNITLYSIIFILPKILETKFWYLIFPSISYIHKVCPSSNFNGFGNISQLNLYSVCVSVEVSLWAIIISTYPGSFIIHIFYFYQNLWPSKFKTIYFGKFWMKSSCGIVFD